MASPAMARSETSTTVLNISGKIATIISVLLVVVGALVGYGASQGESKHTTQTLVEQQQEMKRKLDTMRPASELVTQDQFREVIKRIDDNVTEIKTDLKEIKKNTSR